MSAPAENSSSFTFFTKKDLGMVARAHSHSHTHTDRQALSQTQRHTHSQHPADRLASVLTRPFRTQQDGRSHRERDPPLRVREEEGAADGSVWKS